MRTELRLSDQYALAILAKMKRRKGYVTARAIHEQMARLRYVRLSNFAATSSAISKLYDRGIISRIVCDSTDGRYAYKPA